MCYSLNLEYKKAIERELQRLSKQSEISIEWTEQSWIKAFDFPELPLLMNDRSVELVRWGLVPDWVKDEEKRKTIQTQTLNCRSETMYELASFRASAPAKRAILPVNAFYEYQHFNKNGELDPAGKITKPFKLTYRGKDTFYLACLYSESMGQKTFTIVTTDANTLMAKIHNAKKRMPVVIREQDVERWLQGGPPEKVKDLFELRDEIDLIAEPVEGPPKVPSKEKNATGDADLQGLLF